MRALAVTGPRKVLFGKRKDLALVGATELEVAIEVLLVKSLKAGVEKAGKKWVGDLFYYLCAGLLGVVLGDDGAKLVLIEVVLSGKLVA